MIRTKFMATGMAIIMLGSLALSAPKPSHAFSRIGETKVKVEKGDTLFNIAKFNNINVSQLKAFNELTSDTIYVGQVLSVVKNTSTMPSPSGTSSLTIQQGDTLYSLARTYLTTVSQLKALNGLTSNLIVTGNKLMVPVLKNEGSNNDLSVAAALKLSLEAREHFWSVSTGSDLSIKHSGGTTLEDFTYQGIDYRYFSKEFDTKEKLVAYMNQVYTLNAIDKAIKKYHYIVHNGKMAQPNADSGSLLDWNQAKGKLIYQRKGIRQFEFTVPVGDHDVTKEKVTFVNVNGHWLINNFDAVW